MRIRVERVARRRCACGRCGELLERLLLRLRLREAAVPIADALAFQLVAQALDLLEHLLELVLGAASAC